MNNVVIIIFPCGKGWANNTKWTSVSTHPISSLPYQSIIPSLSYYRLTFTTPIYITITNPINSTNNRYNMNYNKEAYNNRVGDDVYK